MNKAFVLSVFMTCFEPFAYGTGVNGSVGRVYGQYSDQTRMGSD